MQTIPVFAYLVPILILFGFGPTAAMVATLIYAMPPMTRITIAGARARAAGDRATSAAWSAARRGR